MQWKVLEERDISPSPWFPLFVDKVQLPDGHVTDYYYSRIGDVAMVLPITKDGKVVFVRQYKHGARQMTLELPAGRIETDDSKKDAKRELREETGILADELLPLGELLLIPSKDSVTNYGFVAKDVEVTLEQDLDRVENIEVVCVDKEDIDDMILKGEIHTADTVALLHMAKLRGIL